MPAQNCHLSLQSADSLTNRIWLETSRKFPGYQHHCFANDWVPRPIRICTRIDLRLRGKETEQDKFELYGFRAEIRENRLYAGVTFTSRKPAVTRILSSSEAEYCLPPEVHATMFIE